MKYIRPRRGSALALLASVGCSFAPDPELPQPAADLPDTFLESEAAGPYAPLGWWRDFKNPTLDALIDSALVSNLDLVEAVARVEQARAQSGIAWADLFPQIQAGADVSKTSQPANTGIGGALGGPAGEARGLGRKSSPPRPGGPRQRLVEASSSSGCVSPCSWVRWYDSHTLPGDATGGSASLRGAIATYCFSGTI